MSVTQDADRVWESRIAAALSTEGEPLTEQRLQILSSTLQSSGRDSWSRIPRVYATLRVIDELPLIDQFIKQEISDAWFPFTHKTLPSFMGSQKTRNRFIEAQDLVLTKGLQLEREDSTHKHFASAEDIPLKKLAELGRGRFGFVEKVISTVSHKEYARKLLPRGFNFRRDKAVLRDFETELANLKKVSHVHVVQLVGSYTDPSFVGILISPVADCNLDEYLRGPLTHDSKSLLWTSFGCLAAAINYLHQINIRHKDIKPQNILVKEHQVYVSDFGISLDWTDLDRSTTTGPAVKTLKYGAPEVAENLPRNSSSDIWSLGCVFLEIWSVLNGESIGRLSDYLESHGTASRYYCKNLEAVEMWSEMLMDKAHNEEWEVPGDWISWMMKPNKKERWNAQMLFDTIQSLSLGSSTGIGGRISYMGSCCKIIEDTTESVPSSLDGESDGERSPVPRSPSFRSLASNTIIVRTPHRTILASGFATPTFKQSDQMYDVSGSYQAAVENADEANFVTLDEQNEDNRHHAGGNNSDYEDSSSVDSENEIICPDHALASDEENEIPETHSPVPRLVLKPIPASKRGFSLIQAAFGGHTAVIALMLEKDVDVNSQHPQTLTTPVLAASWSGNAEAVQLLLSKGADISIPDHYGFTPLAAASQSGSTQIVAFLLKQGADVDVADRYGATPLHWASKYNHTRIVKQLLKNCADVTKTDSDSFTPLHLACENDNPKLISLLLNKEANIDSANKEGLTPLHWASLHKGEDVVKQLLDHGAKIASTDKFGFTPLNLAATFGCKKVARVLLERGADIEAACKKGETPLFRACLNGRIKTVKLLLAHGADIMANTSYGWSCLDAASSEGHLDVVQLLLSRKEFE